MNKICRHCGKSKAYSEFHFCANTKDKRSSWCKECAIKQRNERRLRFRDEERILAHIWYLKNKDKINVDNRQRHFKRKQLLVAHYSIGSIYIMGLSIKSQWMRNRSYL